MTKKVTKSPGIGFINNTTEFKGLLVTVASIIIEEFQRTADNAIAINNVKYRIDNLVGRGRQNFTKTDVYQVAYLMFYHIVYNISRIENTTFKTTQINTLVAKLMTEGEYGNASVVRRQTTDAKLNELRTRLFPNLENISALANYAFQSFHISQKSALTSAAKRILIRGTRSTRTSRISNRTTRTTTPSATIIDRTPPGFGPDVTQSSFTQSTPPPAPTPPTPPPATDVLIRNMKITDAFDFGIEWEHFGVGLPKLKRTMAAVGQPMYPEYVPYHNLPTDVKNGMFPNGKINKGWWVLQVDGSLRVDEREPASEFRNTKIEARVGYYDTYLGELVSPVLGGKRGLAIIKMVSNALVNAGMRHNPTMGMHTHVTKRGFNRTNIKNLLFNYTVMEPLIESMMEPNRRSTSPRQYNSSHFLRLNLTLNSTQSTVISTAKSEILDLDDSTFYQRFGTTKQQAVNLKPFYGGNTIEFRQYGANYEADSVTMWIAFLFYLCEFSKKKTFKECQWNNLIAIMPVGLASFWYNRIQDLTGKSPYELGFRKN